MGTRTINITLSEEEYEDILKVKESLSLTWVDFIKKSAKCLEENKS